MESRKTLCHLITYDLLSNGIARKAFQTQVFIKAGPMYTCAIANKLVVK